MIHLCNNIAVGGNWTLITHKRYPKSTKMRQEAADRAENRVGDKGYSVLNNNCEHMVNKVLMGEKYCSQKSNAKDLALAFGMGGAVGVAIGGLLSLLVKK